jgi:hypothetical protein
MSIEIPIAVSPVVKKYIAHRHDITPFVVSRSNHYGIFLHNCLTRLKFHQDKAEQIACKDLNLNIYSEKLMLGLTEDLYSRKGYYIHPRKQYDFNRLVELIMNQDFYFCVDTLTQIKGMKMNEAFYHYRDIYHFTEDDLALKTMQKRYERYQNQLTA